MFGSNAAAAKLGLSCSARCRPNSVQAVYWKLSSFLRNGVRQLLAADQVSRRSDARRACEATNCAARTVRPSASAMPVARAALDHDACRSSTCGWKRAAGGDEGLHQPARQIERAALAELVAGLQIEGADHRAHRAGLRHRVDQPGAEQRHLEQEQQLHVLVLEQLLAPHRAAGAASPRGNRGRSRVRDSSASRSACGSGSA